MDTDNKPESFGVFKPVGYVIVTFPGEADARSAATAVAGIGIAASDVHYYSPEKMIEQADVDIAQAGVLASIGQELNLVKAHRELATTGHSFLIVRAPDDDLAWKVADICRAQNAVRAQSYGRFIIEELIEPGTGEKQVGESPDRGLDSQTRSGTEQTAAQQTGTPPSSLAGGAPVGTSKGS